MVTLDDFLRVLNVFPLNFPSAAAIAAVLYKRARDRYGPSITASEVIALNPWLYRLVLYLTLRSANRFANRLTMNNGWRRDPPKWKEDVILVTGGCTGIGSHIVKILAKKSNRVVVMDMSDPQDKIGNVKYYRCDVTNPSAIHAVAEQIRADVGHPTIIYNNAGILRAANLLDTTPEAFILSYKVNVVGCHNIIREFLSHIISINHGHIVTTASSAGYVSAPQLGEYTCSKAAAIAYHEILTAELKHRYNAPKVRTTVVCPTKVATHLGNQLNDQRDQFLSPTLDPAYLAQKMVDAVESGLSGHIILPATPSLTLPSLRSFPDWYRWLICTLGETHTALSDTRLKENAKVYTVADKLAAEHGLNNPTSNKVE